MNTEATDVSITVTHELNRADKRILRALEDGVRNPSWLADELEYSRQYVHQRLQLLVAAEYVENLGHGLYELNELPDDLE
ncbi:MULTISPECIES: helix-turn-helix domain-containing protein [Halobacterium]|uniref:MarR family transcriptional regulator n=1 Tax=Halobacterium TaxID=2239 RepID=UPI001E50C90B|nr:helix-turn-helix domain-containing protein [Halobacterium sp. CBA1132]MCG1002877.1 MarR family transcriptional regulator [Halobacterium noricense]